MRRRGILVFPFFGESLCVVFVVREVPPDLLLDEEDEERELPRRERLWRLRGLLVRDSLRSLIFLCRIISLSVTCSGYAWKSSSPYR